MIVSGLFVAALIGIVFLTIVLYIRYIDRPNENASFPTMGIFSIALSMMVGAVLCAIFISLSRIVSVQPDTRVAQPSAAPSRPGERERACLSGLNLPRLGSAWG